MTFLGYYLHWSHDELMTLEHRERRRWCTEVSQINKKLSGQKEKKNLFEKKGSGEWSADTPAGISKL